MRKFDYWNHNCCCWHIYFKLAVQNIHLEYPKRKFIVDKHPSRMVYNFLFNVQKRRQHYLPLIFLSNSIYKLIDHAIQPIINLPSTNTDQSYIKGKCIITFYLSIKQVHIMPKKRRITKKQQKKIASRRIGKLFTMAEENALVGKLSLADRYVELARKISMRNLTPIKKEYKRRFCKHCYSYLLPTVTCRVRINRGKLVVYCHNCKKYMRIPLKNNGTKPSARLK